MATHKASLSNTAGAFLSGLTAFTFGSCRKGARAKTKVVGFGIEADTGVMQSPWGLPLKKNGGGAQTEKKTKPEQDGQKATADGRASRCGALSGGGGSRRKEGERGGHGRACHRRGREWREPKSSINRRHGSQYSDDLVASEASSRRKCRAGSSCPLRFASAPSRWIRLKSSAPSVSPYAGWN